LKSSAWLLTLALIVLLVHGVWSDPRVLPEAHFKSQIPVFPTLQLSHKSLKQELKQSGALYAISNSWYFSSHQPAEKVASFYRECWPQAHQVPSPANQLRMVYRPEGARPLPMPDDSKATEWVEVEITDMQALNQTLKSGSGKARTRVHITEYLRP